MPRARYRSAGRQHHPHHRHQRSLLFVFRTLCNPGDEILVPEPSYPLFAYLADIQDVKLVRYSLDYDYGWQINFHALATGH